MILPVVSALVAAYLLGAIPFGVILSRLWSGIDIREHGSGNIGATNVFRVMGPVPGLIVMFTDVMKGWVAVWLCRNPFDIHNGWIVIAAGILCIIGHNWSVFLKFQGGKGVNTSLGVVLALEPLAAVIAFAFWILVVAITRYVSLASMLAASAFPIAVVILHGHKESAFLGILAAIFTIYRHRSNIQRLLAGTESKFGQRVEISCKGKS